MMGTFCEPVVCELAYRRLAAVRIKHDSAVLATTFLRASIFLFFAKSTLQYKNFIELHYKFIYLHKGFEVLSKIA